MKIEREVRPCGLVAAVDGDMQRPGWVWARTRWWIGALGWGRAGGTDDVPALACGSGVRSRRPGHGGPSERERDGEHRGAQHPSTSHRHAPNPPARRITVSLKFLSRQENS